MFSKSRTQTAKSTRSAAPVTPSLISHGLAITGDLHSEGEIQIDGTVNGDVDCLRLIVGENASVQGEIIADTVVVRGSVSGRICGGDVSLANTAKVDGDILHRALSIETGAQLDGQVKRVDDPRAAQPNNMPKLLHTGGTSTRSEGAGLDIVADVAATS